METLKSSLPQKLLSGGQSGVDRAALDVALELGIPCGGWCPKGRRAEEGTIDSRYPLKETPSQNYEQRTEWNVRDADGTLILAFGSLTAGTTLTATLAREMGKPLLILDTRKKVPKSRFLAWIRQNRIRTLNVAGPRESHAPGKIHAGAKEFLKQLLGEMDDNSRDVTTH